VADRAVGEGGGDGLQQSEDGGLPGYIHTNLMTRNS
jgi:hypothetical protein